MIHSVDPPMRGLLCKESDLKYSNFSKQGKVDIVGGWDPHKRAKNGL